MTFYRHKIAAVDAFRFSRGSILFQFRSVVKALCPVAVVSMRFQVLYSQPQPLIHFVVFHVASSRCVPILHAHPSIARCALLRRLRRRRQKKKCIFRKMSVQVAEEGNRRKGTTTIAEVEQCAHGKLASK